MFTIMDLYIDSQHWQKTMSPKIHEEICRFLAETGGSIRPHL